MWLLYRLNSLCIAVTLNCYFGYYNVQFLGIAAYIS